MIDPQPPPLVPSYAGERSAGVQRSALGRFALSLGHFVIELAGWALGIVIFGAGVLIAAKFFSGPAERFGVVFATLLLAFAAVYLAYRLIHRIR
jgi:hypothetical protein